MATVEYRNVFKNYGALEVLHGVSLSIADKEFTVLLGPSGCGKTTLLRMTAGLETITKGDLLMNGKRINDLHPRDRHVAMVFQNYALYPTMDVFENIAFSLQIRKLPKDEIRRKVEAAAEMLHLTDYLKRTPKELSGGQRQRVAMGRAMVRDAEVFLFDEPLSNLDAKLRANMRVEIRQLHARIGTTTIYVTHDQIEAMTMADRIVLMKDGRIEQVGTPDDLFDSPVSLYAADFIGTPSMNFIDAVISERDGAQMVCGDDISLTLADGVAAMAGRKVTCGLRPSDLVISDAGEITGKVVMAEKTGADQNLYLKVGNADFVAIVPRATRVSPDDVIRLHVSPEKIHLFDPVTTMRI